jgi:hypothetical protein
MLPILHEDLSKVVGPIYWAWIADFVHVSSQQ